MQVKDWTQHPALNMPHLLADLLGNEFDLSFEDTTPAPQERVIAGREQRVVSLVNLLLLFDAVQAVGWHTHTGDWDWGVRFVLRDGTEVKNTNISWKFADAHGEPVSLAFHDEEKVVEVTACVDYAKVEYVAFSCVPTVDGEPDYSGENEQERYLPVDDIVSVSFGEMR